MILKCFLGLIFISCAIAFAQGGLLGMKECSWGPTHWCKNITNAKNCHAVKHCIQTVWEHQKVPEDKGDICSLCKNMVKDARDQLESNETREMIKEVFEGSCELLKLKPVVKSCIKFADEYAPELVDMLSSQMNPDVICSVAGLCNSEAINKMLGDVNVKKEREEERTRELQKNCEPCMDFADVIDKKIEKATSDDIKSYLLERCRSFGSFSDACSNLVDEYGDKIYDKLKKDFSPSSLCYLTASCINGYQRKIQVKTESDVGVIHVNSDAISVAVKHLSEDQTCELCKQLVNHFKEILTANTTEIEFKQVLKGLCKQMGKFSSECTVLADEYYDQLYKYIVNDVDGKEICTFAGICAKPGIYLNGPVAPFLPRAPLPTKDHGRNYGRVSVAKSDSTVHVFTPAAVSPVKVEISFGDPLESKFQLPIERMVAVPQPKDLNVNNREVCMFCQYLLHYIQKVISQPYGEKELEKIMGKVCEEMPNSVNLQCKNFVKEFGDAFVALLAQEIDPSQVCPSLHLCPARILENKYEELEIGGKPGCPLCLMAVEDITEKLKDNKTEDSIRQALHGLCSRMSASLKSQCDELVEKYTEAIVDMILADFTPQEVCTYLKLCKPQADVELVVHLPREKAVKEKEEMTNEVPRDDHVEIEKKTPPMCFLCEFVMDKIKTQLMDNHTEEEVERVVMGVCKYMPQSIRSDCENFVHRYSEYIVPMLVQDVDPQMVCRELHMCRDQGEQQEINHLRQVVEECAICEALVGAVRALLEDDTFDRNLSRYATEICNDIPYMRPYQIQRCRSMVTSYGPSIINLLVELEVRPSHICPRLGLCDRSEQTKVEVSESADHVDSLPEKKPHLVGGNSCTWGPSYWCQNEDNAKECGTLAHCREMVWKADKPTPAA